MKAENDNGTEEKEERDRSPQSFGVFLAKIGDGNFLLDAAEQLARCLDAMETVEGKTAASLNLKLTFKRDTKGATIDVISETTTKLPKLPASRTVFWVNGHGHLVTENPKQQKLPLREAVAVTTIRQAAGEAK